MKTLLLRLLCFLVIPGLYLALDWLNFVQAGKSALLGTFAILTVSGWSLYRGRETRSGRIALLATLLLFQAIIAYQAFLRDLFGVAQDDIIVIEALFNTNRSEAGEFLLQNLLAIAKHMALMLSLAGLYWWLLIRRTPVVRSVSTLPRPLIWGSTAIFLLLHLNPTMRKEDPLLYFPIRYLKWSSDLQEIQRLQQQLDAHAATDQSLAGMRYCGSGPRTVVLVIGESITRLNWSLYGYSRSTSPQLEALKEQLLCFNDVVTTSGSTILDIEKILTPATGDHPKLFQEQPDLLTIARKVGYKTFWITNHGTDMTGILAIFANHADVTVNTNRGGSRSEGSHDEVVLPYFEQALADQAPLKLIVLHLLNAHPAYYFRYPESFARFNNVDDRISRELKEAGRAFWAIQNRNYYDNALLYSDSILKRTIDSCAKFPEQSIAWLFISDHGEDVAHYSNFVGHNTRVRSMFEIPMLFWRSPAFPVAIDSLPQVTQRPYQTDMLDHTLLGLMNIVGDYYTPSCDVFSPEFQRRPRRIAGQPYP